MTFSRTTSRRRRLAPAVFSLAFAGFLAAGLALSLPAQAHPPRSGDGDHGMEGMMKGMQGHHEEGTGDHDHGEAAFPFGHPSPEATPDREVHITALDTMRFEPPVVTVKAGSVVKFIVTNKGRIPHAWSIDTVEGQKAHEAGMRDVPMSEMMTHMNGEPNGFVLKPGETKTLIWTFTGDGDVEFACHIPGHYPAGMRGAIRIEPGDAATNGHEKSEEHAHGEAGSHTDGHP